MLVDPYKQQSGKVQFVLCVYPVNEDTIRSLGNTM